MSTVLKKKDPINQTQEALSNFKVMSLVYESGIASKFNLKSSTTCVLLGLCYHLNMLRNDCWPHQNLLASRLNLNLKTVQRGINELLLCGLIIKSKTKNGNVYKFTSKFYEEINLICPIDQHKNDPRVNMSHGRGKNVSSPWVKMSFPMIEHENITREQEQTSSFNNLYKRSKSDSVLLKNSGQPKKNDDAFLKISPIEKIEPVKNMDDYKQVLTQLESWGFSNPKQAVKKYGTEKIKKCIAKTKEKTVNTPGAYLRTLLQIPDIDKDNKAPEPLINQMLQHKYWKHSHTGKILQAKPDIGSHLLIRYDKEENLVTFDDDNFTDNLENFTPTTPQEYLDQNKHKLYAPPPKKEDILKQLLDEGKINEVKTLSQMWKIPLPLSL